ncbi:MAG TPA: M13 family metallopeptidase [Gemmatimonadaceae bacterium]|jgi:putative endopeptidase|nr:M13 family metallopeptidase [Gemmatimonadaceae bacterium]
MLILAASLLLLGLPAASDTVPTVHGIDPANLDTTCAPCQDFYQFATGGWTKTHPIPAAFPRWGSFDELAERNRLVLREVLDVAVRDTASAKAPSTRKVGVFYASCMDSTGAEADGLQPLKPELDRIAAMTTLTSLRAESARLQRLGIPAPFGFAIQPDLKHSRQEALYVAQGGLGLPDRDYYTKTDSASAGIRAQYAAHVGRLLTLGGMEPADARAAADKILGLETTLARASMTRVERRDPYNTYHKMTLAGADSVTPHLDWRAWMDDVGAARQPALIVNQPKFFSALDSLLVAVPVDAWRLYFRFHLLDTASPTLDSAFVNENFRFEQVLSGTPAMLPRWQRCLRATDGAMGEALGQAYVTRTFSPAARARARALVKNLEGVLRDDLRTLAWMTPTTRRRAIAKLDAFAEKIGYPDKWRDYTALTVRHGPYVTNWLAARAFDVERRIRKLGRPVDRTEWTMTPPTVNAYYNSTMNEIVFPAGILQPPFFDPLADDAVNYGGIGAVIGHEMTHGFDDQGRKSDGEGNLRDWWTTEDATQYTERAERVATQFDGYVAVDSVHVNGKLTLGEDIADLGGVKIAYAAMERALAGKPRTKIGGFTPEQRFFLSWGQIWRQNIRPAFARTLALTDPHAPSHWRVNGPLSNLPEFAAAWGCKPGDPMVRPPEVRAEIW